MVWQGGGIIVLVIWAIPIFGLGKLMNYYHIDQIWNMFLSQFISGVSCWFLGKYMHRKPTYEVKDIFTKEIKVYENIHTMLFIKVEYWGVILVIISLCILAYGIVYPFLKSFFV